MTIPDRARLGLGTINLLAQLQALEKVSVDALVARAVAMYHHQQLLNRKGHAWPKEQHTQN